MLKTLWERLSAPTSKAALYARVGGPPEWWNESEIIDRDTGQAINMVIECNAASGWLIRYKTNAEGNIIVEDDEAATERLEGRFEIRRKEN